ncbi:MAG: hypothetical protein IIB04_05725 [Acidobacteria bacterium]|nr:hypothetical protein [Acidobacteriota bacterium]
MDPAPFSGALSHMSALAGGRLFLLDSLQRGCRDTDGDGLVDLYGSGPSTPSVIDPPLELSTVLDTFAAFQEMLSRATRARGTKARDLLREASDSIKEHALLGRVAVSFRLTFGRITTTEQEN